MRVPDQVGDVGGSKGDGYTGTLNVSVGGVQIGNGSTSGVLPA